VEGLSHSSGGDIMTLFTLFKIMFIGCLAMGKV
jgi:hypothetical protein